MTTTQERLASLPYTDEQAKNIRSWVLHVYVVLSATWAFALLGISLTVFSFVYTDPTIPMTPTYQAARVVLAIIGLVIATAAMGMKQNYLRSPTS